jgi:hypothetical protein
MGHEMPVEMNVDDILVMRGIVGGMTSGNATMVAGLLVALPPELRRKQIDIWKRVVECLEFTDSKMSEVEAMELGNNTE